MGRMRYCITLEMQKQFSPLNQWEFPAAVFFSSKEKAALMSFHSVSSKLAACCTGWAHWFNLVNVAWGMYNAFWLFSKNMNFDLRFTRECEKKYTTEYQIQLLAFDCYIRCPFENREMINMTIIVNNRINSLCDDHILT